MSEPFHEQLDEILDELAGLDEDDTLFLAGAWQQEDEAARRRAWAKASPYIESAGMARLLDRARAEVGLWAAAGRSEFHGLEGLMGRPSQSANARYAAAPAVLDMVAAILAGDALSDDEAAVLSGPWQALDEADEPDERADEPAIDGQRWTTG